MNIKNLSLSFGVQEIFDDVNIQIKENEKVGVVGVNGAGKSTFFNLIMKKIEPGKGKITFKNKARVGFLPQVINNEGIDMNMSVFDYLLNARPIKFLENKLAQVYNDIANTTDEQQIKHLMKEIGNLQEKLEYYEVYNAENILLKIINGMNIDDKLLDLKLKNLSGGQKSKIAFAHLLYSMPEVLLLDEPTNHLDLETRDYIINYLKNYKGTILVISHDVDFLNEITTQILFIDKRTHKMELFPGNYEKYLKIRNERLKTQERIYEKQIVEEEKLKRIIAKYIGGNEKKANIAKDRQKKLARLEENKVVLEKKQKVTNFKMEINHPSGIVPLSCENLKFGYNENNILFDDLTFDLSRGEKFLIIGENGIGKSTLLKLIMNYLKPLDGTININDKCEIAYYAQEHELLDNEKSIIESFDNCDLSINKLRSFLGNFLFSNDEVFKKIKHLSPGERSRVCLAKIALSKANLLILDEPTNHLDVETQKIIANTFKNYEGTMLLVSHNLEFVDNLGVERILVLPSGQIRYYDKELVMYYQSINTNK